MTSASEAPLRAEADHQLDRAYARLGRNTGFSALSFGLRIGVQVALLVLAARTLSTPDFGQYTLAISLGSIFVVLCDYGFNFLATREVASTPEAARAQLPDGVLAKAWLSGVALAWLGITLAWLGSSRTVVVTSVAMMLSFIANSYGSYLTAILKGLQRFDYETLSNSILYGVLFSTQIGVLLVVPSPVNLALCFLAARVAFVVVSVVLYRRVVPNGWTRPDPRRAWQMVQRASPFALYTFSAVVSVQLGTVVLSYFAGEAAVANFQKALRFGMAATIPLAVAEDVFYAFLSNVRAQSKRRYAESLVVLNNLGAAVIVPIVSAAVLYSQEFAGVVYGAGVSAAVGESIVVVMGAYLLLYVLFVSPTLMSLGRERANLVIWVIGAVVNVVANLLLIPKYGIIGASWAMLVTYGSMKVVFVVSAWRLGLRLTDHRLLLRCLVPQGLAFVALRWGEVGASIGLPLIAAIGLVSVWWLLPRWQWGTIRYVSSKTASSASVDRSPNRIALFSRRLVNAGGAERTLYEEALSFQRNGIDAPILTFSLHARGLFDPPYPVQVTQLGNIPSARAHAALAEARNIFLLRRALRRLQPDIVLASSDIDCIPLFIATLGLGVPYAVHMHGTIFWFDATYRRSSLRYARIHRGVYGAIRNSVIGHGEFMPVEPPRLGVGRRLGVEVVARVLAAAVRKARVIFTLTRHMAWEVKMLYGREAIPIKGAVSRKLFGYIPSQYMKRELGLEGHRVVLNVNRLDSRKRVDLAIRAFCRLAGKYPDLVLVVGGTGPEEGRLRGLARDLGLDGRVRFVGFIPEDQLWDYLAMCDLFVHPNWAEYAISPYEALALQRKVVWSTEMEMDEDIRANQHIFAAEPTVEEFAAAMERALLTDVRTVDDLSKYTWESYTEQVIDALTVAVREGSR